MSTQQQEPTPTRDLAPTLADILQRLQWLQDAHVPGERVQQTIRDLELITQAIAPLSDTLRHWRLTMLENTALMAQLHERLIAVERRLAEISIQIDQLAPGRIPQP